MRFLVAAAAVFACTAGCTQSSQPSDAVFPDDATRLELHVTGGLAPTPAAGSTCTPADDTYAYVLATRALSWTSCESDAGGVYTPRSAQATLAPNAAQQLHDALDALALPPQPCGSDLSATLHVDTPSGASDYARAECLVGFSDVQDALAAAAR